MKHCHHSTTFLLVAVFLAGCFQIGPAYPEKDGRAYLEKKGYQKEIISDLISGEKLSRQIVSELAAQRNTDVRFLVARHPYTTNGILHSLVIDDSDFVRGGAALNPNLTKEDIERIINDPSHTTRIYLARNPNISEEYLLELRKRPQMGLVWFAMNPNCPESIRKEIYDSNDADAIYWLEVHREKAEPVAGGDGSR